MLLDQKEKSDGFKLLADAVVLSKERQGSGLNGSFLIVGTDRMAMVDAVSGLAKRMNCVDRESHPVEGYCGICDTCRLIHNKEHPDVIWVEPSGSSASIKIEDVRKLREKVFLKPFQSEIKICIIRDAERLTAESANALLKTLEEPPAGVLFFLLAESPGQLLPTVVSRCQLIRFEGAGRVPGLDDDQAGEIASSFVNGFYLRQLNEIYEQIIALERNEVEQVLLKTAVILRDMFMVKQGVNSEGMMSAQPRDQIEQWADRFSAEAVECLMDEVLRIREYVNKNANIKIAVFSLIRLTEKMNIS